MVYAGPGSELTGADRWGFGDGAGGCGFGAGVGGCGLGAGGWGLGGWPGGVGALPSAAVSGVFGAGAGLSFYGV